MTCGIERTPLGARIEVVWPSVICCTDNDRPACTSYVSSSKTGVIVDLPGNRHWTRRHSHPWSIFPRGPDGITLSLPLLIRVGVSLPPFLSWLHPSSNCCELVYTAFRHCASRPDVACIIVDVKAVRVAQPLVQLFLLDVVSVFTISCYFVFVNHIGIVPVQLLQSWVVVTSIV